MSANTKSTWKKGQSGNPAGRPRNGHAVAERLRVRIADDIDEILTAVITQAKAGDLMACRLLGERVLPAMTPVEVPVPVPMPMEAGIAKQGEAVLSAVSAGLLAPAQAGALLTGLGTLAKLRESEEFEARLEKLEQQAQERPR